MALVRFRGFILAVVILAAGAPSIASAEKGFDDREMRGGPTMDLAEKPAAQSAAVDPAKKGMCAINGVAPTTPNTAAISVVFDTSASMLDQGRGEEARKVLQLFARGHALQPGIFDDQVVEEILMNGDIDIFVDGRGDQKFPRCPHRPSRISLMAFVVSG